MYEPFPGTYVWNLSVNIALCMGGVMGEIEPANARVGEIAKQGDDAGTGAFFDSWTELADRVAGLGRAAEAAGHRRSASQKYMRALAYYVTAERMERQGHPRREAVYRTALGTMERVAATGDIPCERVEIPASGRAHHQGRL